MTCQLTATVEWVADMMYQLTPMKFIPLPNSEMNIAVKKKRNARCPHSSYQYTRCVAVVANEPYILQSKLRETDDRVQEGFVAQELTRHSEKSPRSEEIF